MATWANGSVLHEPTFRGVKVGLDITDRAVC